MMWRNCGQVMVLFDEMSSFYGQLDLYKHSLSIDRKTLLSLKGGGSWLRTYTASLDKTAFNVSAFIQPAFVYEMLNNSNDADGVNDRQLFDFPPEREVFLADLEVPMPQDTPDLFEQQCTINPKHEAYRKFYDDHVRQKI